MVYLAETPVWVVSLADRTHWIQSQCWSKVIFSRMSSPVIEGSWIGYTYATVSEETNCMDHAVAACLGVYPPRHQVLDIISKVTEKLVYEGLVSN